MYLEEYGEYFTVSRTYYLSNKNCDYVKNDAFNDLTSLSSREEIFRYVEYCACLPKKENLCEISLHITFYKNGKVLDYIVMSFAYEDYPVTLLTSDEFKKVLSYRISFAAGEKVSPKILDKYKHYMFGDRIYVSSKALENKTNKRKNDQKYIRKSSRGFFSKVKEFFAK